ncbi:MAG: hypothetical protein K2Y56_01155 [Methylobacterium sp.]|uniref:hypothetical protein n=1 Tax=Methylobacterium sp. TaxID=409 RepID=UPI0025F81D8A|nr:hypothetical protein [Methylobacterium sp.]MBX9930141.1 hypothetical protein [Methylobacterium sp.]
MTTKAWAMRTSRDSRAHRDFIFGELLEGRLRQGWGWLPEQDLATVSTRCSDPAVGYAGLSNEEKMAWGHWRLLGEGSHAPEDAIRTGDTVLVPNVPENGTFTLCRVTGPYRYDIPVAIGDLGHIRPVEVLTPGGVAYTSDLVLAPLRRSLSCRSRLWSVDAYTDNVEAIAAAVASGDVARSFAQGTDHLARAQRATADKVQASVTELATTITEPLRAVLKSAEWEPVLTAALVPLMRDVEVIHTGGAGEEGADIEIHVPNPFAPESPWVVAVQLKDYEGEIHESAADQIEQAITARLDGRRGTGALVAVILAATKAHPSTRLSERLAILAENYRVEVSCVHGDALMRVMARGLFMRQR